MICQYETKCPFCETEEEFISTSEENFCGGCGKITAVVSSKEVILKKEENHDEVF